MERMRYERSEFAEMPVDGRVDGWNAWEAAPRDGPGIFVIDTVALDRGGQLHGRWLDPTSEPETLRAQVRELLGREPVEGSWAIVDQVELGPVMAPETLAVDEVGAVAHDLAGGGAL